MNQEIWENYWKDQGHWDWWKKPATEVIDLIRSLSSATHPKVLDLGCGLGRHAIAFAQAGFSVTAVDGSGIAIEHVKEWAGSLGLSMEIRVCNLLEDLFPQASFDVVLSYNVIYHGSRELFACAIRKVHALLKPGGLFFFTCPSRRDGKYGFGEELAPHTYRSTKSVTDGDVHYFPDERDFDELLEGFQTLSRWKSEGWWNNKGTNQFFSNWHIQVEKISRERF
jgi:SAM-dependent methyltransferase